VRNSGYTETKYTTLMNTSGRRQRRTVEMQQQ